MSENVTSYPDLATTPRGVPICESRHAGGNYCEHALFAALYWEKTHPGIIGQTVDGNPLIGFLHVPEEHDHPETANRHDDTLWVLGQMLNTLIRHVSKKAITILLTGYGPFGDITNNPSGHLITSTDALERLTCSLLGTCGAMVTTVTEDGLLITESFERAEGSTVHLRLITHLLPVAPGAVNGSKHSLQYHLEADQPHGVILMGIACKAAAYRVETCATQENFRENVGSCLTADGTPLVSRALVWALVPESGSR